MTALPLGRLRGHAYFVEAAGGRHRPPWAALAALLAAGLAVAAASLLGGCAQLSRPGVEERVLVDRWSLEGEGPDPSEVVTVRGEPGWRFAVRCGSATHFDLAGELPRSGELRFLATLMGRDVGASTCRLLGPGARDAGAAGW